MHGSAGHEHGHEEKLKRISIALEEGQIELLREIAKEYAGKLGQRWSISAVVRVAVGDLLTKMGKIA
ncbi:MAG: hypothetical protein HY883_06495 [Deltaproteobacteria bacterium]|nr:hypothetical protein [Deltaproteobacteria bacterium]